MSTKKLINIFILIIAVGVVALFIVMTTGWWLFLDADTAAKINILNQEHSLDGMAHYYIDKNVSWLESNHNEVFPAEVFYVLVPVDTALDTRAAFDFVEGKKIGKSSVNMDEYLEKTVTVRGEYYYGEPLTTGEVAANASSYIKPQVVIDIQEIKIVE